MKTRLLIIITVVLVAVSIGFLKRDVIYNENMVLVFKSVDESPACVKPLTEQKLIEREWTKNNIDKIYSHPDAEFPLTVGYGEWYDFHASSNDPNTKNIEKLLEFDSVKKAFEYADDQRVREFNYGLIPPHSVLDVALGLEVLSVFQELFPEKSSDVGSGNHNIIYDGKPYSIGISLCSQGCPRLK